MGKKNAVVTERTIMKAKGECMTIGDLRLLVQSLEDLPHDYQVIVNTDSEFDLAEVTKASIEFGESRSSDGPGWVLLNMTGRELADRTPSNPLSLDPLEMAKAIAAKLRSPELLVEQLSAEKATGGIMVSCYVKHPQDKDGWTHVTIPLKDLHTLTRIPSERAS